MKNYLLLALLLATQLSQAQTTRKTKATAAQQLIEGIVTDKVSGLPLAQAQVIVSDDLMKMSLAETVTDADGAFSVKVAHADRYAVTADKPTFFETADTFSVGSQPIGKRSLTLSRKPGYVFDITIFDKAFEHNPINMLTDCKVEIYNNTTRQEELVIPKLNRATFNFSFAEGNHYTVLVRKQGYLNRRIEVYVNVDGCILCVDGMGVKEPDIVPLMQHGNEVGFFLGAIDLDSISVGKRFRIDNIYYDFDKWNIRPDAAKELDKLALFLKDNPAITVELGSHTDSRGTDAYNLSLSERRAQSAVAYLTDIQGIDVEKITSKGYGETQLVNACGNDSRCSEADHQLNRRTELKITGATDRDPLWDKSLKQIIEDPNLYRKVIEQEKRKVGVRG